MIDFQGILQGFATLGFLMLIGLLLIIWTMIRNSMKK